MGSRWKEKVGAMIITPDGIALEGKFGAMIMTPDGIALEGEGGCDDHDS